MTKNRLKKFGLGIAVLALAAVGAGLSEGVKEAAKSTFTRTISWGQEQVEQLFPSALPQADKTAAFSIFVAKLDGDTDGSQSKHVRESLRRSFDATDAQPRVEVREIPRVLREGTSSDVLLDHQKAIETAKEWLKQSGAHVLIWGAVADRNRALRLFFLPAEGTVQKRPRETYTLTDHYQLSEDFGEDLGLVIAAKILAQSRHSFPFLLSDDATYYERFKAVARQRLIRQTKAGCQLKAALAEMMVCGWDLTGGHIDAGIEILQEILGDSRCAADGEVVAQVQDLLGFAFLELGELESGTARLEQAVATYRATVELFAKAGASNYATLNVANTRRNLANAETLLAKRRGETRAIERNVGVDNR
jgi:tetratricopeptide (TPR) repeat protein